MVTADNRNGSGLRVWDLFNGLLLISKTKENKSQKHKKKRYELTPRYQRVRPKYGQSALHLSSGRENRQAPSETHETFHPARIAFHGRTAWGSNPHKGLRLPFFFLLLSYQWHLWSLWCTLSSQSAISFTETRSLSWKRNKRALSKWLVFPDFHIKSKYPKLILFLFYMTWY